MISYLQIYMLPTVIPAARSQPKAPAIIYMQLNIKN